MTWYFNFCAPTIPNDSVINFHRGFQTAELMTLMVLFTLYHLYYKLCVKDSTQSNVQSNSSEEKSQKSQKYSEQKESQQDDDVQYKSESDDNNSVSIAQKIRDLGSQNQSYIEFKKSKKGKNGKKYKGSEKPTEKAKSMKSTHSMKSVKTTKQTKQTESTNLISQKKTGVTVQQVQSYFPIVFGHHAIAMAMSIMYSPYAQQSIAGVLYVFFSFFLAMANSKRLRKTTFGLWIFMAFLNIFILMSALLQLGQSNWDFVNKVCFAQEYVGLY